MNDRIRQKCKAMLRRDNHDVMLSIKTDSGVCVVRFVPRDKLDEYKEKYGDRLTIWQ